MTDYLDRLPEPLRILGNSDDGEIQIIATDRGQSDATDSNLKTGIVFEDRWLMVVRDQVRFPDQHEGHYVRIVEKAQLNKVGGTVIVPVVDGCIVFVELYRHATRRWEWELPRGYQEPGLTPEQNAMKETQEEIGVAAVSVSEIGRVTPNTGLLSSEVVVFAAMLPSGCIEQMRGEHREAIRSVLAVPFEEVDRFIQQNVRCGFSLSAMYWTRASGIMD
ncbi:NUDIX hydrolase [Stieleria varia]|uniref:Adenosine nucleotide hydrolase NudE n=1 Tax=Stieleria varia TaxID=2528005 RepID=A0A5C6B935_9BACT|nr:NUDIX hydrolase [Stieleria varia]TWU07951.1 adenosine nucleotide hydrolase NudE [Stieleria varia]